MRAVIAIVKMGPLEFEGLMLEDGTFAVAIPQLAALNLVPKNLSLKRLETLLGMVFPSPKKVKTELNSKAVNCISLSDFEQVLRTLNKRGVAAAVDIVGGLLGMSLAQLFSDAFGVKFDEEDRQALWERRLAGKVVRRGVTDSIKDFNVLHNKSDVYRKFIYSNVSDALNVALFGKKAKELREERGVETNELLRDSHSVEDLTKIEKIELLASVFIDKGDEEPLTAMRKAIAYVL